MAFLFSGATINGTADDDFIFGILGGPDHTLNGGAGNDIIVGDHHALAVGSNGTGNNSIANAFNLDDIGNWYTGIFRLVEASGLEYTTVFAEGEGDVEVFSVTVGADESFIVDIDFANFDAFVEILDGAGNVLASNDTASFLDQGSSSLTDPRVSAPFTVAGTYFIRVSEIDDGSGETNIEVGEHFFMNVTVNNHVSSGVQVYGDDIINGDAGDDTIWGLDGDDTINGGDGNDIINAGEGIDAVNGGAGDDLFIDNFGSGPGDLDFYDGGDGIDTLDISGSGTTGSEFNLITGQQTYLGTVRDTFANIENITVANSSTLIGNDENNVFIARGFHVNIISGNGGDDIIDAGRLGDTVDGGDGFDFISFNSSSFNNVVVNLGDLSANTNDAEGDTYTSIEGVIGTNFNDTITGDDNENVLVGGEGADALDGGGDIDFASYHTSTEALTINLSDTSLSTGEALNDTYTNIEGVIGTDFADTITGDDTDNIIIGGAGADILDGGAGSDFLNYETSEAGVSVNLETLAVSGGDAALDVISNFENLSGSDFIDTLIGDIGDNRIFGLDGNDDLQGSDGDDFLEGGNGDDLINGGSGLDTASYVDSDLGVSVDLSILIQQDTVGEGLDTLSSIENLVGSGFGDVLNGNSDGNVIEGGAGDDDLDGGAGTNTASYAGAASGTSVDLSIAGQQDTLGAGLDTLSNFSNLLGSAFADTLTGDANDNILTGGAGADTLVGGAGFDAASYAGAGAGVTASLFTGVGSGNDAAGDTFTDIEELIGSDHNDVLVGRDGASDTLRGGDGFDGIRGNGGDDFLYGDGGDDFLFSGFGADFHDGGTGIDTVLYNLAGAGVIVNLTSGTGAVGQAEGDTFVNVENVVGTAFADLIVGADGANSLQGRAGNDTLDGRGGADILNGGNNIDTVTYASSDAAVVASLFTGVGFGGHAAGDSYIDVEALIGSDFDDLLIGRDLADDTLTGGDGSDGLRGNGGDDMIFGEGGDDLLFSGFGADHHDGGAGVDTLLFDTAGAGVIINLTSGTGAVGQAEGDTYVNIENVVGTAFGDLVVGSATANRLEGRAGNDVLDGRGGADVLIGGNNADRFVFEAGYGTDRVEDFSSVEGDVIDLSSYGFASFASVQVLMFTSGADTVISLGGGDAIRLVGVDINDLDETDFLLSGGASKPQEAETEALFDTLAQDMVAEFLAITAIQNPIYQTDAQGILEILTEDDMGYDWDGFV